MASPRSPACKSPLSTEVSGQRALWRQYASFFQLLCVVEIILGALMIYPTMTHLYNESRAVVLGLNFLAMASAAVGLWGLKRKKMGVINLHVVGALLVVLIAFQCLTGVNRQIGTDCALSELFMRTDQLANHANSGTNEALLQAVDARLQDVEGYLSHIDGHVAELHEGINHNINNVGYLREKMDVLQQHAKKVISAIHANPALTPEVMESLPEDIQQDLQSRVRAASQLLQRLKVNDDFIMSPEMDYDEYLHFLRTLTQAATKPSPTELVQLDDAATSIYSAHMELPRLQKAMEKRKMHKDVRSDKLLVGKQMRAEHQSKWTEEFLQILKQHYNTKAQVNSYRELPEHCLKGKSGQNLMSLCAILLMMLGLTSCYVAMLMTGILMKSL